MAVESATWIAQLNPTYPQSSDGLGQADDHLRLIKSVLQSTFPNLSAAVVRTADELNTPVPIGFIGMWYGAADAIPQGWALCNGSAYTRSDGNGQITSPDLRDKFILGAGTTAVGTTGGNVGVTTATGGSHDHGAATGSSGAHTHTGSTGATALTEAQLPVHYFYTFNGDAGGSVVTGSNSPTTTNNGFASNDAKYAIGGSGTTPNRGRTNSVGSGATHVHTISSDGAHTHTITAHAGHTHTISDVRPPFYALCYIMKI